METMARGALAGYDAGIETVGCVGLKQSAKTSCASSGCRKRGKHHGLIHIFDRYIEKGVKNEQ